MADSDNRQNGISDSTIWITASGYAVWLEAWNRIAGIVEEQS
jgi:hypothetical protein